MTNDRDVYRPKTAAPVADLEGQDSSVFASDVERAAVRAQRSTSESVVRHDERLDGHDRILATHGLQMVALAATANESVGMLKTLVQGNEASATERHARRSRELERERRRLRTKITLGVISGVVAISVAAIKVFA